MKVLVTGGHGQLGRELAITAPEGIQYIALGRQELNIADVDEVQTFMAAQKPQLVINAAAYTAVDLAESEPQEAQLANATGPANLALACAQTGARLLHISTDFVFAGDATSPYRPESPTGPIGEYGRSKLAGEQAVLETLPSALILRTSWVYSRHGGNFVKTMLRLMNERSELNVVSDQRGTPTWARGLALACWAAAQRDAVRGILHWSDGGECSWYDFARAIYQQGSTLGLVQQAVDIHAISTEEYPTPARRPAYSVLDKSATQDALQLVATPWEEQLQDMLQDLKANAND